MSAVALAAALLLTIANIVRHHRPIELIVGLALLALISARLTQLIKAARRSG